MTFDDAHERASVKMATEQGKQNGEEKEENLW